MFTEYGMFLMDKRKQAELEEAGRFQRTDSFRKVLPSKPSASVDSRLSMSMRMVERPIGGETDKGTKAYTPFMVEYALLTEYQLFRKKEINGLYVVPSDKDPLVWYGVLFVHQGIYQGGVFRFQIRFPSTFPDGDCPRIIFDEGLFHPAISPDTGDLNVTAEFREWRKTVNHVWQVLQYAKVAFFKIETKAPLNQLAAQLLIENPAVFKDEAHSCVARSQERLYAPPDVDDLNFIRFEPFSEDKHGPTLQKLICNS